MKMRQMLCRSFAFLICMGLIVPISFASETAVPSSDYSISLPYDFPVLPGTPEWAELESIDACYEACVVPDSVLHEMTTAALLETVLVYPFASEIWYCNSKQEGFESLLVGNTLFQALFNRNDAGESLLERYMTTPVPTQAADFRLAEPTELLEIWLVQNRIQEQLTAEQRMMLWNKIEENYQTRLLYPSIFGLRTSVAYEILNGEIAPMASSKVVNGTVYVRSKWGDGCLVEHPINALPKDRYGDVMASYQKA